MESDSQRHACGGAAAGYGERVGASGHVLRAVLLGFELLLFGGVPSVLFAPRLAVFLIFVGFIGYVGTHVVMGIVHYRRTMRRPWPRVPPIEDDDDEW
jgi:hypothetical protein